MLVNRLDSPYRPSHHKQWSHQQNRSGVPLCRYRDSRKVVAVGVRRGSRTWSAVSRCKQRKLQAITRQHTVAPVTLVQTLPCDPINSFNGEWSVLLTRVKKRERYHSCWATIKKNNTHTQQLQQGFQRFRNLISALPLLHSWVSPRIIWQSSRAFYRSASVLAVTDASGPD